MSITRVKRYYSGPVSDHFDGDRFFNPGGRPPAGLGAIARWRFDARFRGNAARWPKRFDSPLPRDKPPVWVDGDRFRHVFIGHAAALCQFAGLNVLIDPHWSKRCSPSAAFGPTRYAEPGIAFDDLPLIDVVCVTHSHYDHLDRATILRLQRSSRRVSSCRSASTQS